MTEAEYLASDDPAAMLAWLSDETLLHPSGWTSIGDRERLRWLAAVGCDRCRHAWRDDWSWHEKALYTALADCSTPAHKAALLRDVAGNPFRPVRLPLLKVLLPSGVRAWDVVVPLARAARDEPLPSGTIDPARLLVLADALEEAGCPDGDLLRHLRGEELVPMAHMPHLGWWRPLRGPHVRGCWAVESLLGEDDG